MAKELAGAVCVVTGGSSGIGRACARLLAARGAKVYVLARSKERLAAAVEEIEQAGGFAEALVADVASPEELAHAAAKVRAAGEGVDILVAGAGIMDLGPADQMPLSQYEAMMRVNYLGVVGTVQSFLPLVKEGRWKRIAIVSSLAAKVSPPYFGAYSASKAAVTGFAHALRQELAREGIRVTLVHPGPCATPLVDGYIGGEYYPVPPGVPVIAPDQVARAIWRGIRKGRREVFVPRRLAVTAWLAGIAPGAVDGTYRLLDRGKRGK
ncbi:MAG TPA: SDR family oxidoreductase [Limnochordia bacterium]|nr:SDR family oxidoreductase [Limnochordia bacterium]